jgi:hypothetical protein
MGDKFLTKEIADALCTVITLGFIENNDTESQGQRREKTSFQYWCEGCYESKGDTFKQNEHRSKCIDYKNHNSFVSFINDFIPRFKVALAEDKFEVSLAENKSKMPCIMAKIKKVWNLEMAQDAINFWNCIADINSRASAAPPRGAYIGGIATVPRVDIIGSTNLSSYEPKYRIVTPDIEKNYEAAFEEIDKAVKVFKNYKPKEVIDVHISKKEECCTLPPASIGGDLLFSSYHGMIRAMVEFHSVADPNIVHFEIALGANTNKVSSCIPCSIFMSANDMAATSTHFGRGDNWGIPKPSGTETCLEKKWRAAVINHYTAGSELCKEGFEKINQMKTTLKGKNEEIPAIFLEALTFEGPFLEKMANTLGFPYEKGKK